MHGYSIVLSWMKAGQLQCHNRSFNAHRWSSCFCLKAQIPTVSEKEVPSLYWEVQATSFQPLHFLSTIVFWPVKNIENPRVYFLFFIGLLLFCCPGASHETASVNLVWKETSHAYTFRESKLFLILHLKFFTKTSLTCIEWINIFVPWLLEQYQRTAEII